MRRGTVFIAIAVTAGLLAGAYFGALPSVRPPQTGTVAITAELITDRLDAPVFLTSPPDDPRLFVLEKLGRIRIIEDGVLLDESFLDVEDIVELGPEQGLLGLAFHPDYATNGRFFVYYTTDDEDLRSHVVEYAVSADNPNLADPDSAQILLTMVRPSWRHNAGWMDFGADGLLYVSSGDGGGTDDPNGHGQNIETLMATIFRMDVDDPAEQEVVAWGLRNPWRAAFDGDQIYIGDVGQDDWEEINTFNLADAPVNFGWSIKEGDYCYRADECDDTGLVDPLYVYHHDEGCSVTGGYVYRGAAIPELNGQYFFADWCNGWVRSIDPETGILADWTPVIGNLGAINSFGIDSQNELYVVVQEGRLLVLGGAVYKIVPQ